MLPPHRVVIAAFPGVELLDVTGPAEVFSVAARVGGNGRSGYTVRIATADGEPVATSSGIRLLADLTLDEVIGDVDTLLVAGAVHVEGHQVEPVLDRGIIDWLDRLREAEPGPHRIGSVCAGAHLLAAAGLLDGLSATTHWVTAARLAADHPRVSVDPDPIFIRAGRLWTCAGITSGMDMALAMVAEDRGPELALATARMMVMYVKRAGGQSQFSVPLAVPAAPGDRFDDLRTWIGEHLTEDLSADALATRLHLSVRHFSRLFRRRTGTTPAAYVESVRLEEARRLLQDGDHGLPEIAAVSGLGSVESLHRSFRRRLGTTPAEYRRRFR
ncbi:GlxA family transcriptional regulator [Streptomyces tirandamycinicus]|uniref:AraC family transcriptional regulator n=1 Tax=Streptomyces tirandamycinicus TaxID=2174846 RepID=A0A2S1SMZ7_9ACTN|nr:helix-turn-helix domain-containing protein [Streptomyces tirandamycinicus]AWI27759.1 AraC family transcriptional regulator [Streptomyces tirandamycinicus]